MKILFNADTADVVGLRTLYALADSEVELLGATPPGPLPMVPGWDMIKRLLANADKGHVFHLHGVWEPTILIAGLIALARGVRFVVTPHGMLDPWSLSQRKARKRLALRLIYKRILDGAGAIHVLTEAEGQHVRNLGVSAPIRVLPNGIDPRSFRPLGDVSEDHIAAYPWMESRYALFLGRLHPKKGIDLLIDAFRLVSRELDDVQLAIVGPDQGERPKLEAQVRELGLAGRIHFTGPVYDVLKYRILRRSRMFCLTSWQEGFSMGILEALASGVPVVISEQCNFPEIATAGAGRVVKLDVEEIAEAMRTYFTQESDRSAAGGAGLRLVTERYTWAKIAQRSISLFSLGEPFNGMGK